jgi:hypothetical protein
MRPSQNHENFAREVNKMLFAKSKTLHGVSRLNQHRHMMVTNRVTLKNRRAGNRVPRPDGKIFKKFCSIGRHAAVQEVNVDVAILEGRGSRSRQARKVNHLAVITCGDAGRTRRPFFVTRMTPNVIEFPRETPMDSLPPHSLRGGLAKMAFSPSLVPDIKARKCFIIQKQVNPHYE